MGGRVNVVVGEGEVGAKGRGVEGGESGVVRWGGGGERVGKVGKENGGKG